MKGASVMVDIERREEVMKDHFRILPDYKSEYTIKKVFEDTKEHGDFHYHMSNCGHQFLNSWDINMIWDEPMFYPEIEWRHYVFAAVFVHYWSSSLFDNVPDWVHKYKYDKPKFQYEMPQEMWNVLAADILIEHNWYAQEGAVWYV